MQAYLSLSLDTKLAASDAVRALLAWGKLARRIERARSLKLAPSERDVVEHRYLERLVRALASALALPELDRALAWAATGKAEERRARDLGHLVRVYETAQELSSVASDGEYFRSSSGEAETERDAVRIWYERARAAVDEGYAPIARALAAHWGWGGDARVPVRELIARHGLVLLTDAERETIRDA